ncbi:hypothetical protein [Mesobacillus persicus]|nr:hypothetical protein [Mesobacillus persicus]
MPRTWNQLSSFIGVIGGAKNLHSSKNTLQEYEFAPLGQIDNQPV